MAEVGQLVNAKALAGLFDLTERRVQQLAKDEIIPKAERGKYPFIASIKGYVTFLKGKAFGNEAGESSGDIHTERTRLYRANADRAELELAEKRGELLPADVVHLVWTKQIGAFRAKMMAMPVKLAAELHGIESKKEIQAIAKQYVWEALQELADSDGPDYRDIRTASDGAEDSSAAT